jgi:hypothetical protein
MIAALGALGVVSPHWLLAFARRIDTTAGLYAAAAFRVIFGLVLLLAAPDSRAPELVQIIGIIIVAAGLIAPLMGPERFRRLIAWWSGQNLGFMRAWAGLALVFGIFVAYAMLS